MCCDSKMPAHVHCTAGSPSGDATPGMMADRQFCGCSIRSVADLMHSTMSTQLQAQCQWRQAAALATPQAMLAAGCLAVEMLDSCVISHTLLQRTSCRSLGQPCASRLLKMARMSFTTDTHLQRAKTHRQQQPCLDG
jgi:hypothetical protein